MPGFQGRSSGGPIRRSLYRLGVPRSQPGRYWECWCIHSIVWSLSNRTWAMQTAELSGWIMTPPTGDGSPAGDVESAGPSIRHGPVVGVGRDIPAPAEWLDSAVETGWGAYPRTCGAAPCSGNCSYCGTCGCHLLQCPVDLVPEFPGGSAGGLGPVGTPSYLRSLPGGVDQDVAPLSVMPALYGSVEEYSSCNWVDPRFSGLKGSTSMNRRQCWG